MQMAQKRLHRIEQRVQYIVHKYVPYQYYLTSQVPFLLKLMLHIVEDEQLPMTLMNGIRLFVHGQDEAVQKENSQHVTSLRFLNSFAIDYYYVSQISASCISVRSDDI